MSASKLKNIYGLLGKPVASSTPLKRFFDTKIEHFSKVKKKAIRNDMLPYADHGKCANMPTGNVVQNQLEIVSSESDSDSDILPSKKARQSSPKANVPLATSNIKDAERKKKQGNHIRVKKSNKAKNTVGEDVDEKNLVSSREIATKKPKPHKCLKTSSENLDLNIEVDNQKNQDGAQCKKPGPRRINSKLPKALSKNAEKSITEDTHPMLLRKECVLQNGPKKMGSKSKFSQSSGIVIGSRVSNEPKINMPNDNPSSSSESGRDSEDQEKHDCIRGRKLLVKKNNLSQKDKFVSLSPEKLIEKTLDANLSTDSQKHNKVSEDGAKKIATPVTEMPPARQRQSLSRTLSRISASASCKFMVEIPKNLADSFSESLQLIKRRIDFESIDKPEEEGINVGKAAKSTMKRNAVKELAMSKKQAQLNEERDENKGNKTRRRMLKSQPETETVSVSRTLTTLKPVHSAEKKTTENEWNGVRKSLRTRNPPIAYWMGSDSQEQNQLFAQNRIKKKRNSRTSLAPYSPKQNKHLKKHSSLRASSIKEDSRHSNKTSTSKSVRWEDVSRNKSKDTDVENQMKVCFSTFDQSVFLPADDDDDREESGVQYAESLQANDMQSEFIRLLSGAETADLSKNSNQLYTVLENTVSLDTQGVLKKFRLHSQFYVQKGVSHKLLNNSREASLLLQVIIK